MAQGRLCISGILLHSHFKWVRVAFTHLRAACWVVGWQIRGRMDIRFDGLFRVKLIFSQVESASRVIAIAES